MREEAIDIAFGKLTGMAVLMELDIPANPMHVGFFCTSAVVPDTQNLDDAVVQSRLWLFREESQRISWLACGLHGRAFRATTKRRR